MGLTDPGDSEPEDEEWGPTDPPALEVDLVEPVVLGELLGPDGEVMYLLLDRRPIPFGFQCPPS